MPPYRADQVGSLLRPPEVLEARDAFRQGTVSADQLRQVEDNGILSALELQRQVGIDVLTDGEYRRSGWASDFADSVDGYVSSEPPIPFEWRMPDGGERASAEVLQAISRMPQAAQAGRVIGEPLRLRHRLTANEATFLKAHADGPFKVTLPAASYIVARGFKPGVTEAAYTTRADLAQDVVKIIGGEVQALAAQGVAYIQLDNPHYPDYIEPSRLDQWRAIGIDPEVALREDVSADNATVQGIDRARVTVAMHVCRGNGRSAWHTQGGYERIAEQVFGGIDVDRWLLEYDTDRAGRLEPLRFIPKGKKVVLGLITTKVGALESRDDVMRRIDDAAKYVPLEDLSLSPQCGFASVDQGNLLSWDDQRRKLELVVQTARRVWG
jgi:5-methyltetrahydropteroyltriglutamate--homocysteine methyltransferase